jgi:DNA repair exonuclease SbcCD ATPase subunit
MAVSLEKLENFLEENIGKIETIEGEVEEIQVGFNSAYQEFKDQHDATLRLLSEKVVERLEAVEPELRDQIEQQAVDERGLIAQRMTELKETLIPTTQAESDDLLTQAQAEMASIRKLNPSLNEREEGYKAERAELEAELERLNAEISRLSGCLGVVIHFLTISRLDRQRQQIVGQLQVLRKNLREVRQEWQEAQKEFTAQQQEAQTRWQEANLKLARLREELSYLEDEEQREALAMKRAVYHVLDELKTPVACSDEELGREIEAMTRLNIQTDDYQESLGKAAGLIALLSGVRKGMVNMRQSVNALIKEQRMHSAHLPKLKVNVPSGVMGFHEQWDGLRQQVRDEARLCANPQEFIALFEAVMSGKLNQEAVEDMFQTLGQALTGATAAWKGRGGSGR